MIESVPRYGDTRAFVPRVALGFGDVGVGHVEVVDDARFRRFVVFKLERAWGNGV